MDELYGRSLAVELWRFAKRSERRVRSVRVCKHSQGVGAELGLQQPPPLQEEHGYVEGVHIRVWRGSAGHQLPQQHPERPLYEKPFKSTQYLTVAF